MALSTDARPARSGVARSLSCFSFQKPAWSHAWPAVAPVAGAVHASFYAWWFLRSGNELFRRKQLVEKTSILREGTRNRLVSSRNVGTVVKWFRRGGCKNRSSSWPLCVGTTRLPYISKNYNPEYFALFYSTGGVLQQQHREAPKFEKQERRERARGPGNGKRGTGERSETFLPPAPLVNGTVHRGREGRWDTRAQRETPVHACSTQPPACFCGFLALRNMLYVPNTSFHRPAGWSAAVKVKYRGCETGHMHANVTTHTKRMRGIRFKFTWGLVLAPKVVALASPKATLLHIFPKISGFPMLCFKFKCYSS